MKANFGLRSQYLYVEGSFKWQTWEGKKINSKTGEQTRQGRAQMGKA